MIRIKDNRYTPFMLCYHNNDLATSNYRADGTEEKKRILEDELFNSDLNYSAGSTYATVLRGAEMDYEKMQAIKSKIRRLTRRVCFREYVLYNDPEGTQV